MKTKIEFEEKDFDGCGQLVIKDSFPSITTAYKIGYGYETDKGQVYYLVSMADGMIVKKVKSKKEIAAFLNDGYRPMTQKEIVEMIGGQGNRFVS